MALMKSSGRSVISVVGNVLIELAVDAEPAHPPQAVAVDVEELLVEQVDRLFELRRIARTQSLVDLQQRFFVAGGAVFQNAVERPARRALSMISLTVLRPDSQISCGLRFGNLVAALDDDFAAPLVLGGDRRCPRRRTSRQAPPAWTSWRP